MTDEHARQNLRHLLDAVTETVAEAGDYGAPAGPLYAALMAHGCTLEQFETIMGLLCRFGMIHKRGHLYFAGEAVAFAHRVD